MDFQSNMQKNQKIGLSFIKLYLMNIDEVIKHKLFQIQLFY